MKPNESSIDRIIRVTLGVVLLALPALSVVSGALGIVLVVLGIVALATGVLGYCPLYSLLRIRTNKV